ncbi:MAG: hypothetical protein AB1671_19410 [Thermodesulfobacteriota bacterium]|jgi:hypothetical protein
MAIDFVRTADFLHAELQAFYTVQGRSGDGLELQQAVERLRSAVDQVEALADDPGEEWKELPMGQRWGISGCSLIWGTAIHELKKVGWFIGGTAKSTKKE